jgi:hypothetical protein
MPPAPGHRRTRSIARPAASRRFHPSLPPVMKNQRLRLCSGLVTNVLYRFSASAWSLWLMGSRDRAPGSELIHWQRLLAALFVFLALTGCAPKPEPHTRPIRRRTTGTCTTPVGAERVAAACSRAGRHGTAAAVRAPTFAKCVRSPFFPMEKAAADHIACGSPMLRTRLGRSRNSIRPSPGSSRTRLADFLLPREYFHNAWILPTSRSRSSSTTCQ